MFLLLLITLTAGCASTPPRGGAVEGDLKPAAEKPEGIGDITINEFIIGVGDSIDIDVYRQDDLKKTLKVGPSGKIMYPLIGDVTVAGKSIFTLRDELQTRLSKYIVDPQVAVYISEVKSQKVLVLGEVKNPGIFTLGSDLSVMEAIMNAGGMTADAKTKNVLLVSRGGGKTRVSSLNLKEVIQGKNLSEDKLLHNGDMLYVPAITIANVSRYFGYLTKILGPINSLGSGVVVWDNALDILNGNKTSTNLTIPAQ